MAVAVPSPARAQTLIGGVVTAGSAVMAVQLGQMLSSPNVGATIAAALIVALAVALADQFTLDLPHGGEIERFAFTDAVWIAAILLAPAGAPTLGAALGTLGWQILRRVPPAKIAYNVAQVALALTAAELTWQAIGFDGSVTDPGALAAATAASIAAFAVNDLAVALVIAMSSGASVRHVLVGGLRVSALQWLGAGSVGLLAVLAWEAYPAAVVLVVPPLWLVHLAHREFIAGLVEREQMEDLARTAERIAWGGPSRRLPTIADSGRIAGVTESLNSVLHQLERSGGKGRELMRAAATELHVPVGRMRSDLCPAPGSTVSAAAQRVLAELDSLESLLSDMEDVDRIARAEEIQPAVAEVSQILHRAVDRAGDVLEDRVVTIDCSPVPGLAVLDADWVERAVGELLSNAAEHGGAIELSAAYAHGGWRIEVTDDGPGVPDGHEDAIFEPFHRATGRGRRAGLGLAVVRAIAEAHGGAAGLVNRPSRGATFWLRLPSPLLGPERSAA